MCTRSQQPWAIPFAVSEQRARESFSQWTNTGHAMTSGIFELKSIRPEHVPCYVFEGQLHGQFTGVLTYKRNEVWYDVNGKRHTRRARDEYYRQAIPFAGRRPIGADTAALAAVYAGFEYRTKYAEPAATGSLTEEALSRAVPLTEAEAPAFTGVGAFAMKPSYAFARVQARLVRHALEEATATLHSAACDRLEFHGGGFYPACPSKDWQQPDSRHVRDVEFELEGARLHDRGVCLTPLWVVEYTYGGEPFRCFVGGVHANVTGITHLLSRDATVRGAAVGTAVGLLASLALKAPIAAAEATLGGALVGGLAGYLMAMQRASSWADDGRRLRRDEQDNVAWRTQNYWQEEVRRVMRKGGPSAGASSSSSFSSRFGRRGSASQQRRRQQQEQEEEKEQGRQQKQQGRQQKQQGQQQRQQQRSAPAPPSGGWRQLDDYDLLGVRRTPPPTAAELASAYRREAMRWHPDHNQLKPAAEVDDCEARFKQLNEAYGRLRRAAVAGGAGGARSGGRDRGAG